MDTLFFKFNNASDLSVTDNPDTIKGNLLNILNKRILAYKLTTNDLKIEKIILNIIGLTLKQFCFKLLQNVKLYLNNNNQIIIKITQPLYNKIARLISFGDGGFAGSRILYNIFEG